MSDGGFRVRAAVFRGHGRVYHPAGHDNGSRRRGFPIAPPPLYKPPKEQTWTVKTLEAARDLARDLRLRHGDNIAVAIEPVDPPAAAPRPRQTSLASLWEEPNGGEHG